jgi:hypothetical protein
MRAGGRFSSWNNEQDADGLADVVDFLRTHPDARRKVVQFVGPGPMLLKPRNERTGRAGKLGRATSLVRLRQPPSGRGPSSISRYGWSA